MEKPLVTLDRGTTCSAWNYCGQRLATGSEDGTLGIFDTVDPSSSTLTCTSRSRVHEAGIVKVIWAPPEYGDAIACIFQDGTFSLLEEVVEGNTRLAVAAHADGHVKVLELLDALELKNWQVQAEFQNVIDSVSTFGKASCSSASISWSPEKGQQASFVMGFISDTSQFSSSKVWEYDEPHQRWLPVAELALPGDRDDQVYAVAWAPNIGRPYEVIAIATQKGIAIWHLGLKPNLDGRLSVDRIALLTGHEGEVWQLEWDMGGMTLASTGEDGMVRLWQSNLNGVWHEQAAFEPVP